VIDLYCERTAIGFWNEPYNAISNFAILIVAILAWRKLDNRAYSDYWEKAVIVLAATIAIGSFLFHTFATSWSAQADIIPIWMFVISYTLLVIFRLTGHNTRTTITIALTVIALMLIIQVLATGKLGTGIIVTPTLFNGSLQYLPVLIALIGFTGAAHLASHVIRNHLLLATALFFIALVFRSIDIAICEATFGTGTHFLWHLFNAAVIGTLLYGLIDELPPTKIQRSNH